MKMSHKFLRKAISGDEIESYPSSFSIQPVVKNKKEYKSIVENYLKRPKEFFSARESVKVYLVCEICFQPQPGEDSKPWPVEVKKENSGYENMVKKMAPLGRSVLKAANMFNKASYILPLLGLPRVYVPGVKEMRELVDNKLDRIENEEHMRNDLLKTYESINGKPKVTNVEDEMKKTWKQFLEKHDENILPNLNIVENSPPQGEARYAICLRCDDATSQNTIDQIRAALGVSNNGLVDRVKRLVWPPIAQATAPPAAAHKPAIKTHAFWT